MRTQHQKHASKNKEDSLDSNDYLDDSSSYSGVLGKRNSNDTSVEQLKGETEDSGEMGLPDSKEKRERRLQQNRKSAKKCRLKKKAEYGQMRTEVNKLQEENKTLKEKINEMTLMLYQKIEDNSSLQRKLEQAQMQQIVFLSQMVGTQTGNQQLPHQQTLNLGASSAQPAPSSQGVTQTALQSLLGGNHNSNFGLNQPQALHAQGTGVQKHLLSALSNSPLSQQSTCVDSRSYNSSKFILPPSASQMLNGGNFGQAQRGLGQNFMYKNQGVPMNEEIPMATDLLGQLKQLSQRKMTDESLKSLMNLAAGGVQLNNDRKISM